VAAFVEAFWSPLTTVPYRVKIMVGLGAWMLLLAYFALAGRGRATR
jgi:cytochrome bd-type quinol oxidase subunit 1